MQRIHKDKDEMQRYFICNFDYAELSEVVREGGKRERCVSLSAKSLVDEQHLNTVRVEGVGSTDNLVVVQTSARSLEDLTREGTSEGKAPLDSPLVGLSLVLDNLVGSHDDDDILGSKGNTSNLGA